MTTIAELFAILDVDATAYDAKLAEAEINLEAFAKSASGPIQNINQLLSVLSATLGENLNPALARAATGMMSTASGAAELYAALQLLQDQKLTENRGYSGSNKLIEQDMEAAVEFETQRDVELMAERQRHDAMMEAEETRSAADQARIDAEMLAEREQMYKRAWTSEMEYYEMRRASRLRDLEEERYQANLAFETSRPMSGGANAGGSTGARMTAYELQGIDQLTGVKLPWAFTRILSTLPEIQSAMSAAFDVLLIVGFLDILYQVGSKLVELTDYANGWGQANIESWEKAFEGAQKARLELIKYHDEERRSKEFALKEPARARLAVENTKETIADLLKEQANNRDLHRMEELNNRYEEAKRMTASSISLLHPSGEIVAAAKLLEITMQIRNEYGSTVEFEKELNAAKEHGLEIAHMLSDEYKRQRDEENKAMKERETHVKKMRDEVHEYPHILPWFMSERSSQQFLGKINGPTLAPPRSIPAGMSGMTVIMHNTFHGMPADSKAFVRDVMAPQLAKDFEDNVNGIGKRTSRALSKH